MNVDKSDKAGQSFLHLQGFKCLVAIAIAIGSVAALPIASQPVLGQESEDNDLGIYIDNAIVRNRLRFRFDAAFDNPFPDRAEFFYPMCGCFSDGNGPGPPEGESSVDYQVLQTDIEVAFSHKFSGFVELPIRFINPEINANSAGLSDVRAGFKYGLIADDDRWLTFQLRGYFPTGDGDRGLGTEHVSLEPGFLFQRGYDRWTTFGEFKAWIPIGSEQAPDGREFSGNVLRYGAGAGYDLYQRSCTLDCQPRGCSHDICDCEDWSGSHDVVTNRLTSTVEVVGWTVLGGLKDNNIPNSLTSAAGDTIVNLKLGLRWSTPRDSVYLSYGLGLTSEVWYQDIVRVGYDYRF